MTENGRTYRTARAALAAVTLIVTYTAALTLAFAVLWGTWLLLRGLWAWVFG